jgi:hypothetical protein
MQTVLQLATPGVCTGGTNTVATLTFDGSPVCIKSGSDDVNPVPEIDPALRQKAFDASVFWQFEDVQNPDAVTNTIKFVNADNGLVRGGDSFESQPDCTKDGVPYSCQEQRILAGLQFIQTDYPWHFVNDTAVMSLGIPVDPSQRVKATSTPTVAYHEPGNRLYFQTDRTYPGTWIFATVPNTSTRWLEATVSSTRNGDTWGDHIDSSNLGRERTDFVRRESLQRVDDDVDILKSYLKTERIPQAAIEALEDLTVDQHKSWKTAVDRIKKLLEK